MKCHAQRIGAILLAILICTAVIAPVEVLAESPNASAIAIDKTRSHSSDHVGGTVIGNYGTPDTAGGGNDRTRGDDEEDEGGQIEAPDRAVSGGIWSDVKTWWGSLRAVIGQWTQGR